MLSDTLKLLLILSILIVRGELISDEETLATVIRLREVGLTVDVSSFRNFGETVVREQVIVVIPVTTYDIKKCLQVARERSVHVRAVGTGSSWSELFPDEGNILLDMVEYQAGGNTTLIEDKIFIIPPTRAMPVWQMNAPSNLRLSDVNEYLITNGLAIASPTTYANSTLAGLISTASHGSHWKDGSISDYVTAMSILNGDGEFKQYSMTREPEVMAALRACIGACGIILEVTIIVSPIGKIERAGLSDVSVGELFSDPTSIHWLMKSTFSWSASWEIYNNASQDDRILAYNPGNGDEIAWRPDFDKLNITYFNLLHKQTSLTKRYVPDPSGINVSEFIPNLKGRPMGEAEAEGYLPELIYFRDFDNGITTWVEAEYFINDDEPYYTGSRTAVKVLTDLIWDWTHGLGNLPLHRVDFSWMRRSKNECYLCPSQVANVSGLVFAINLYVDSRVAYTFRTDTFFEKYYSALREKGLRVYPHLAKRHAFLGEFWFRDMPLYYSDSVRQLLDVRRQNRLDPSNIFLNKHLEQTVFNPEMVQALAINRASADYVKSWNWLGILCFLLVELYLALGYTHFSWTRSIQG